MSNNIRNKLRIVTFAAALAATTGVGTVVHAAEYTMKLGTATVNDVQTYAMEQFAKRVEEASDGRIETELYPAAQLGSNARMIEGMQLGTLEFYTGPTAYFVGVDPRFQVTEAPGVFRDAEHAHKVYTDPEFREAFLGLGAEQGLVILGIYPYGTTSFATDFSGSAPQDFEGKKIRVMASELERAAVSELGATAVPIDFSEVTTALQQGTIDGVKTSAKVFTSLQLYDIVDYLVVTEENVLGELMAVSKVWFESLPADLQDVLRDEARDLEPELLDYAMTDQKQAYEDWEANGGTVQPWDEAQRQEVISNMRANSIELLRSNDATAEMFELMLKVAEKY